MKKSLLVLAALVASLALSGCMDVALVWGGGEEENIVATEKTPAEEYIERINKCISDGYRESAIRVAEEGIEKTGDEEIKKLYFSLTGKEYGEEDLTSADEKETMKEEIKSESENNSSSSNKSSSDAAKDKFLKKAAEIESYSDSLDYGMMNQHEINRASADVYERWDKLLNEVYQYHKDTLPADEFEKLQEEEIEWVKEKELAIAEDAAEWGGGSGESMVRSGTGSKFTKERCYELIEMIK